ncbi:MAG: hypothetical protein LBU34_02620 [Planctomycetaceae bacterium]|jgi:hypothetical protein|nr:hypothetical protein [Planctomycetaceae bacterium]
MNLIILKLAFRESGMYIVPVILILTGYVLLGQDPLPSMDNIVTLLAVLLGIFLSWRSFADYGNVRAFLFSRSYSPERFFLVRWLFGLGTITATGLVLAAIIGFGIRQSVQQGLFANGWFPMIRFEELRVLMCYGFGSLLAYHTTLYFMLTNRFRSPVRRYGFSLWLWRLVTLLLILYGVAVLGMVVTIIIQEEFPYEMVPISATPYLFLIFGVPALLQILIAPWFGIYCYKNQEIES